MTYVICGRSNLPHLIHPSLTFILVRPFHDRSRRCVSWALEANKLACGLELPAESSAKRQRRCVTGSSRPLVRIAMETGLLRLCQAVKEEFIQAPLRASVPRCEASRPLSGSHSRNNKISHGTGGLEDGFHRKGFVSRRVEQRPERG